jgi:hypothetical protein
MMGAKEIHLEQALPILHLRVELRETAAALTREMAHF